MEDTEDEDLALPPPLPLPPPPPLSHYLQILQSASPPVGAWLGLGLGLCLFSFLNRSPKLPKPLSVAIKVADGALKGTKILTKLQTPHNPDALLLASKALANGYKVSKRLPLMRPKDSTAASSFTKMLRAYVGAVNLLRHTRSIISGNGAFGFGLVTCGYKVSDNFFKVLEGFVGFELDGAVKKGLKSVGLVLKAVKVVGEIRMITSSVFCRDNCVFRNPSNRRFYTRLGLKKLDDTNRKFVYVERLHSMSFSSWERDFTGEGRLSVCVSDLLFLSLPIEEVTIIP